MELVPIKVKIGLRPNKHADHPDWTQLPLAQSEDPAAHMIDGWKYDKTSGHAEHTADSPRGMQWGCVLVTEQFADEAMTLFPALVTKMTEAEFETFWNEKAYAHVPANRRDADELVGLKAELDLSTALGLNTDDVRAQILKALDPDDPLPGVRKTKQKLWTDAKKVLDVTVKELHP